MRATITQWPSLVNTSGRAVDIHWPEFFTDMQVAGPFLGEQSHPGWSPVEFAPCERAATNARKVFAMVLDYDGTENIDTAANRWSQFYGLLHTTRKHTADAHRFRVILPLGRPISRFEHESLWRRLFAMAEGKLDSQTKDVARFWFTPGANDPAQYMIRRLCGQPLDPDEILAQPEPVAKQEAAPLGTPALERASAYLDEMDPAISGSGGHVALWRASLALVRGFKLSESDALALLKASYNPRCQPPWSDRELRHKVSNASKAARCPDGWLLRGERFDAAVEEPQRQKPAPTPAEQPESNEQPKLVASKRHNVRSVRDLLSMVCEEARRPKKSGCPSGNKLIDAAIGGYRSGFVTVLGATTNWGKSSFGVMSANASMDAGHRVLLISGEDSEHLYGSRIMTARCKIKAQDLRDKKLDEVELVKMEAMRDSSQNSPFFLNGIGKTAEYLAEVVREIVQEEKIDLVIVDYLQAFSCSKKCQDRRTEVTHIARCFTDAIKSVGAAGLIFSQLKRMAEDHTPTMFDLKESGDVENGAEHVLIGYWKKANKTGARVQYDRFLTLEKNKDGPRFDVPINMPFDFDRAAFETR